MDESMDTKLWQDCNLLLRLAGTLRIVLASIFTLILLLVWQMPFASLGLYFVFLLSAILLPCHFAKRFRAVCAHFCYLC